MYEAEAIDDALPLDDSDDNDNSKLGLRQAPLTEEGEGIVEEEDSMHEGEGEGGNNGLDMFIPVIRRSHRFCLNCTGRVPLDEDLCNHCGHLSSADAELILLSSPPASESLPAKFNDDKVALLFDERMELHDETLRTGSPHPERPDRIRAIMAKLMNTGLKDRCRRIACREATVPELCAVHTGHLIKMISSLSSFRREQKSQLEDAKESSGLTGEPLSSSAAAARFDPLSSCLPPDTYVNEHTFSCARIAAGSSAEVAMKVARGEHPHGAAIVRPPGHHAESGMSMGFCFFNNAAVAARAAQSAGARRVIILDWDIHHGNGTQHIFDDDPSVLYISLHRHDHGKFYPGTGAVDDVGTDEGEGFTVNVPWNGADMGNGDYLSAFNQVIIPIVYEFNPDLIIVSAGFDAADGDPIGECRVTSECFGHMTSMLKDIAPLVLLLEGGYNLKATASATEACLRVLLGEKPGCLPGPRIPCAEGKRAILDVCRVQSMYWKSILVAPSPERGEGGREADMVQECDEDVLEEEEEEEEEIEVEEEGYEMDGEEEEGDVAEAFDHLASGLPKALGHGLLSHTDETEAWHSTHPHPELERQHPGPRRQPSVNSHNPEPDAVGAAAASFHCISEGVEVEGGRDGSHSLKHIRDPLMTLKRHSKKLSIQVRRGLGDKWRKVLLIHKRVMRQVWRKRQERLTKAG